MKKLFFSFPALAVAVCLQAHGANIDADGFLFKERADMSIVPADTLKTDSSSTKGDKLERNPAFPGGKESLMQYLMSNVHYPQKARENQKQGRVIVSFVVAEDGFIENVAVLRGVDPDLDAEAVRVIKGMPKWQPGMQKGVPVRVKYTIPITFSLPEKKKK